MKSRSFKLGPKTWYVIFGVMAILAVYVLPFKTSSITLMTTVAAYGLAAIGFNILLGYSGQISLGHAAFVGLGAYVSAFVTENLHLPFFLGLLLAGLVPVILGLILGAIALRLEGHYLAIATLGFGVAVQQTFKVLTQFTNGFAGKTAPGADFFGIAIKSGKPYFVLCVIIVVLGALMAYNLIHSKTGRALIAMRDSEHAARAMGIDLVKYKLIAFSISAFYAGVAGSLYIHLVKYTQPDVWGMVLSINLLGMVVVGGLTSIGGSILGAAFITLLPHLVMDTPILKDINSSSIIMTGLLIVIIIRYLPGGLISLGTLIKRKVRQLKGGPKDAPVEY